MIRSPVSYSISMQLTRKVSRDKVIFCLEIIGLLPIEQLGGLPRWVEREKLRLLLLFILHVILVF